MIPWHGLIPYFNPLPRKEGDSEQKIQALSDAVISIHSLVKRETAFRLRSIFCKYHFNPLPRKEGDRTGYRWLGDEVKGFQSTPS